MNTDDMTFIYHDENTFILFSCLQPYPATQKNGFRVGMRLEGIDPKHPSLYCVLTVAEIRGFRVRLHFDGYSECYDFWTNADSPFIFPVGWVEKNSKILQPPKGGQDRIFSLLSSAEISAIDKDGNVPESVKTFIYKTIHHKFNCGIPMLSGVVQLKCFRIHV